MFFVWRPKLEGQWSPGASFSHGGRQGCKTARKKTQRLSEPQYWRARSPHSIGQSTTRGPAPNQGDGEEYAVGGVGKERECRLMNDKVYSRWEGVECRADSTVFF